jgi:hypothetical protein
MNDVRRPGGNAAEVLAEARRAYAAKLATSLKWVQEHLDALGRR